MKFHLNRWRCCYGWLLHWADLKILILVRESLITELSTRRRRYGSVRFLMILFLAFFLRSRGKYANWPSLRKRILSLDIEVWIAFRTTPYCFEFPWTHLLSYLGFVWIYHRLSKQIKCDRRLAKLLLRLLELIKNHLPYYCFVRILDWIRFHIICDEFHLAFSRPLYHIFWYHQIAKTFKGCTVTTMMRFFFFLFRYLVKHLNRPIKASSFSVVNLL